MKRREFIAGLGGAMAWPVVAPAQQSGKVPPRLGVLLFTAADTDPNFGSFRQGLQDLGYAEGRNLKIEYWHADGKPERLRNLAAEMVISKPDVILALGGDVAPFARAATSTTPIVMVVSVDPVQAGLAASLARPGGNITGVTFVSSDLAAKRLQSLVEMAPNVTRVAVIWNPDHIDPEYRETQLAARTLGVHIQSLEVRNSDDFEPAFAAANGAGVQAIIPISSRLLTLNRGRILEFATQHQLVLASGWGPWAREGALFSYGPDLDAITRRAAAYVDKILRGAKPDELPVEGPTSFQLVINMKTAKALALSIPQSILLRAGEVIE